MLWTVVDLVVSHPRVIEITNVFMRGSFSFSLSGLLLGRQTTDFLALSSHYSLALRSEGAGHFILFFSSATINGTKGGRDDHVLF